VQETRHQQPGVNTVTQHETVNRIIRRYTQEEILAAAEEILRQTLHQGDMLTSPDRVRRYLRMRIGAESREHFVVLFLNSQNMLIQAENMFSGTVSQTAVYPREIVRRCMQLNASSVILAHNHPSGAGEPSSADELLTKNLRAALALVDVRVLDHVIVTAQDSLSFAETGRL
jgi:DNA repair protein RadC